MAYLGNAPARADFIVPSLALQSARIGCRDGLGARKVQDRVPCRAERGPRC